MEQWIEAHTLPALVNFCRREQGLIVAKGNPKKISEISVLKRPNLRIVNRPLGTGTRLLLDRELSKAGIMGDRIDGYANEVPRHLDVGMEVLSGRADVRPGIRAVASFFSTKGCNAFWDCCTMYGFNAWRPMVWKAMT